MSQLWLSLLILSFTTYAQVERLDTIEVTSRKDISAFTFSQSEQVSSRELETNTTGLISSLLEKTPGVISNQNGGPGGRVSFFLRGTESRHVAFTLDGLKLNDPSNTDRQFDSAFFTSPFLKEIQLHKGPQAVLFGSDALGGLIELTSRKGENGPEARIAIKGGSFGTSETSVSKDWKNFKQQGTLTVDQFHSDGISRLNKKRFKAKEKDASDIAQITSSSSHKWSGQVKTDLLASFLRGHNELDGATSDNSHDESTNDQYIFQQKTELRLGHQAALSLRNGLSRHQRKLDTLSVGKESYEGDLIQNEVVHRFDRQNLKLIFGAATEHEDFELSSVERSFDLHSLFAQSAWEVGAFQFQAGARTEKHTQYGNFHTGSGGVSYQWQHSRLSLQYSQGFKAPSLYQLHAPPLFGSTIGNPDLVPEVNHSWEGAWTRNLEQGDLRVSLFQNRLSNLITYTTSQGYLNQNRFVAEGVELSGKWTPGRYEFHSSYTYQQFRKQESLVLRRPHNLLQLGGAVFLTDASEISLKLKWFSSRRDLNRDGDPVKLNPYETIDLGFRYLFVEENVDLGLQLLNLLDREYEELYGYSVMPRALFLHLGIRF